MGQRPANKLALDHRRDIEVFPNNADNLSMKVSIFIFLFVFTLQAQAQWSFSDLLQALGGSYDNSATVETLIEDAAEGRLEAFNYYSGNCEVRYSHHPDITDPAQQMDLIYRFRNGPDGQPLNHITLYQVPNSYDRGIPTDGSPFGRLGFDLERNTLNCNTTSQHEMRIDSNRCSSLTPGMLVAAMKLNDRNRFVVRPGQVDEIAFHARACCLNEPCRREVQDRINFYKWEQENPRPSLWPCLWNCDNNESTN